MGIFLFIQAALLGIVEGITEFLPISSTGHLILVENWIKISNDTNFVNAFDVIIQLGAILAVVVYFWNKIWPFSGSQTDRKQKWILWSKIAVAAVPAALIGLKFDKVIEARFFNSHTVAITLILYGAILIIIERINSKKKIYRYMQASHIGYSTALIIGLFQCLALIPGTSRSAATIIGGMLFGLSRAVAAEFSFFLAIPTMLGATLLKVVKSGLHFHTQEWMLIGIGFFVSFIVALLVIGWLMNYIQKRTFSIFGYYRIFLGLLVIILLYPK